MLLFGVNYLCCLVWKRGWFSLEEYERKLAYLHRLQGINASFEAAVLPVQKDEVSAASGGGYSSRLRHRAQFT